MPATATGRGAQVILEGDAQAAARGAYLPSLPENTAAMQAWQKAGLVADGSTPDGRTLTGFPADEPGDTATTLAADLYAQPIWPIPGAIRAFDFTQAVGTDLRTLGFTVTGDATGTAKIGSSTITLDSGAGTIVAKSVDLTYGATDTAYTLDMGTVVHSVEAFMNPLAAAASPLVCVHVVDTNNWVGLAGTFVNMGLYQRIGGSFTTLWTLGAGGVQQSKGTWRLEARPNNTVAVYFGGNLMTTQTLHANLQASTKCGFIIRPGGQTNAFTDWRAYAGPVQLGIAQGGWSQIPDPRAVTVGSKTWFGYVYPTAINSDYGAVCIGQLDHATGVSTETILLTAEFFNDDHGDPTILVRPDGRLVAFYCYHLSTLGIYYKISVNVGDATVWGAQSTILVPSGTGLDTDRTYPTPIMCPGQANRVYLFFRGAGQGLSCATSDNIATCTAPASAGAANGTVTFTAPTIWVNSLVPATQKGIYAKVWGDGGTRIDLTITNADEGASGRKTDARHFYWDGTVSRGSNGLQLPAFPLTINDMTPIATSRVAPDFYGDVIINDIYRDAGTGRVYVVFVRFLTVNDHRYYYAVWDGATWSKRELPFSSTSSVTTKDELYYNPGIVLDAGETGVVYCGIGNAVDAPLYRYVTLDGGVTWARTAISPPRIEDRRYDGINHRPVVPRNRDASKCAVLWWSGTYDAPSTAYAAQSGGTHTKLLFATLT